MFCIPLTDSYNHFRRMTHVGSMIIGRVFAEGFLGAALYRLSHLRRSQTKTGSQVKRRLESCSSLLASMARTSSNVNGGLSTVCALLDSVRAGPKCDGCSLIDLIIE